jgi:putative ABC transport system substrate-binding protein
MARTWMIGTLTALLLVVGMLPWPLGGNAQQAGKVYRIGYLGLTEPAEFTERLKALHQGMQDLGYEEGRHYRMEYRWAERRSDRYHALAAELVQQKVDLILAASTATIQAAKDVTLKAAKAGTKPIPIVMTSGSAVLETGLIASLGRPGGNITGVITSNVELNGKRLDLLKEMVPRVSRVAILGLAGHASTPGSLHDSERVGRDLGLHLQVLLIRGPTDLETAFAAASRERAGALHLLGGPLANDPSNSQRIAALALEKRLPAVSLSRDFVDHGGLMFYGVDLANLYRRAAAYVDKVLKGANPAELPVEEPTKRELAINL